MLLIEIESQNLLGAVVAFYRQFITIKVYVVIFIFIGSPFMDTSLLAQAGMQRGRRFCSTTFETHSSSTSSFSVWAIFGSCCRRRGRRRCHHHNVFVFRSQKRENAIRGAPKRKSQSPNLAIMINFTFQRVKTTTNIIIITHTFAHISIIIIFWQLFDSVFRAVVAEQMASGRIRNKLMDRLLLDWN